MLFKIIHRGQEKKGDLESFGGGRGEWEGIERGGMDRRAVEREGVKGRGWIGKGWRREG